MKCVTPTRCCVVAPEIRCTALADPGPASIGSALPEAASSTLPMTAINAATSACRVCEWERLPGMHRM